MTHYTLNTGHSRQSPRGEVADDVLRRVAYLTRPGDHRLPGPLGDTHRLLVPESPAGYLATLYSGRRPVTTFAVAATEADGGVVWTALERLYLALTDAGPMARLDWSASRRPDTLPWCAAAFAVLLPTEAGWVEDFERCLAWAWLDGRS